MRSICAWCLVIIREDKEDPRVTHGMCDNCLCEMLEISSDELARQRAEWASDAPSGETASDDADPHEAEK